MNGSGGGGARTVSGVAKSRSGSHRFRTSAASAVALM